MWRVEFQASTQQKGDADDLRKRQKKSPLRKIKAGLAKGGVILWSGIAIGGLYLAEHANQPQITVSGPTQTPQGPKWQLSGRVPGARAQNITLNVNGAAKAITVRNGRVSESVDLVPGQNTINFTGPGLHSKPTTIVVPPNPALISCDCNSLGGGGGGIIPALDRAFSSGDPEACRAAEQQLKAGTTRYCDSAASGPGAWPKNPVVKK
jgi:hypothetical protein